MSNHALTRAPRYRFGMHDKITIGGVAYRWVNADDLGHMLRRDGEGHIAEFISHEDLYQLVRDGALVLDRDHYLASKAALRGHTGGMSLTDLPKEELETILWRQSYCDRFLRLEQQERAVSRTDAAMQMAIYRIKKALDADELARLGRSNRCGVQAPGRTPPSPSRLREWLRRYQAAGYDALALRDNYSRSGNRNPRIDMESADVLAKAARRYAASTKPTKAMLYQEYEGEVKAMNDNRNLNGLPPLTLVCKRTFEKAIDKLNPFHVCAGREGEAAARRKFGITHGGLGAVRPLERIEMDEWKVSLQVLLTDAGLWQHLTPQQRAGVERTRVWLSAAVDTATECVLSLRLLAEAPSANSAIACLEMAVTDKAHLAAAAGARTPWDMHGTFETVAMDSGAAFVAAETKAVIQALGAEALYPPSGAAEMRGTVERMFGTFQLHFIRYFAGQTFENIFRKGDYDSVGNACIDMEELNRTLIRYVVDAYHNTPHAGLAGETPRNAWLRLTAMYPIQLPPDIDTRRNVFGLTTSRRIQNRGIRFLGIHYQSEALQKLRRTVGQKPVDIRVNRFDLSEIAVRVDGGWLTVGAAVSGLDLTGVSVWEWTAAAEDLRRKHADMAKVSADTVRAALAAVRGTAAMAVQRAELGAPILSDTDCAKMEDSLFSTFSFRAGGTASDEDILADDSLPDDEFALVASTQHTRNGTPNPPVSPSSAPPVAPPSDDEFGDETDWLI